VLSHKINVMDTRDLARAVSVLTDTTVSSSIVTLSGHNTTTNDLLETFCRAGSVPSPQLGVPAALSIIPLLVAEAMWATIGSASPVPSLLPALLCEQGWMAQSPAQQQILSHLRSIKETVDDTIGWYRTIGYC
jgi:hypothetical protein